MDNQNFKVLAIWGLFVGLENFWCSLRPITVIQGCNVALVHPKGFCGVQGSTPRCVLRNLVVVCLRWDSVHLLVFEWVRKNLLTKRHQRFHRCKESDKKQLSSYSLNEIPQFAGWKKTCSRKSGPIPSTGNAWETYCVILWLIYSVSGLAGESFFCNKPDVPSGIPILLLLVKWAALNSFVWTHVEHGAENETRSCLPARTTTWSGVATRQRLLLHNAYLVFAVTENEQKTETFWWRCI